MPRRGRTTMTWQMSRRELLRISAQGVIGFFGASLAAACSAQPPAPSATAPAQQPPATSSGQQAAAATTAPAQQAAATSAPAAPAQAAPGTSAQSQTLASFIGKLEGPTIITDSSQFPKTFKEAPQLAD